MNHEIHLRKRGASNQLREALIAAQPGDAVLVVSAPHRVHLDGEPIVIPNDVTLRQHAKCWFVLPEGGKGFRTDSPRFDIDGLAIEMRVPTCQGTVAIDYGAIRHGDAFAICSTHPEPERDHARICNNVIRFVPRWPERLAHWWRSLRFPFWRRVWR